MSTRIIRLITAGAAAVGLAATALLAAPAASAAGDYLSAKADGTLYNYGARTTIRGHLTVASFYGHNLPVQISQVGSPTVHGSTRVDSHGNFKLAPQLYTNTAIALIYPGDSSHKSASVVLHSSVRVRMSTIFKGDYKTGGGYYYVHAGSHPDFGVGISPSKAGRNVAFRLQVYYKHSWQTVETKAYAADNHSIAGVELSGSTGYSYRIRAEYGPDSANASNSSAYAYLRYN